MKRYVRDGRSPVPRKDSVSRVMSANRGKDTGPELMLRKALRESGLAGYRLNWRGAPGRPDIAYVGRKVAVFVNGCFWHRCPGCNLDVPKSNKSFWIEKFARNAERDARKKSELEREGWTVLVLWECEIKEDVLGCVNRVRKLL